MSVKILSHPEAAWEPRSVRPKFATTSCQTTFPDKRLGNINRYSNNGHKSIKVPPINQFWPYQARQNYHWDRVVSYFFFLTIVAMKHAVLSSSFLLCIPPQNAMKSKLPFDGAEWSAYGKRGAGGLQTAVRCTREDLKKKRKKKKKNEHAKLKGQVDQEPPFTHWSFCFVRPECYLISGRQILSPALSSAKPDGRLFKEWRNNKHPLRLDVRLSTKPRSVDVPLPPW